MCVCIVSLSASSVVCCVYAHVMDEWHQCDISPVTMIVCEDYFLFADLFVIDDIQCLLLLLLQAAHHHASISPLYSLIFFRRTFYPSSPNTNYKGALCICSQRFVIENIYFVNKHLVLFFALFWFHFILILLCYFCFFFLKFLSLCSIFLLQTFLVHITA
jgi:hypothetical protein